MVRVVRSSKAVTRGSVEGVACVSLRREKTRRKWSDSSAVLMRSLAASLLGTFLTRDERCAERDDLWARGRGGA